MPDLTNVRSPLQNIRLLRDSQQGLILYLDGAAQFAEATEYRYHECLGVVPMLFHECRTIFIGGGGDGLLAFRLLRFPEVQRVVVCDYDGAVTDLASTQPDLVALNGGSLSAPRVEVINQDAMEYLQETKESYDLILSDFPVPVTRDLSRLYSLSFFDLARKRLNAGGLFGAHITPVGETSALAVNTARQIFPRVGLYRVTYADGGQNGFFMASRRALKRIRAVPEWTRFLEERVVDALFAFGKDERCETSAVNTEENHLIARTAMLELWRGKASTPHMYNRLFTAVTLDDNIPYPRHLIPDFLHYSAEQGPLVIYVDRGWREEFDPILTELGYGYRRSYHRMSYTFTPFNMRSLDDWWKKTDNGSVTEISEYMCRTTSRPELVKLFQEYLDRYPERYLDVPNPSGVFEHERSHLVVRNRRGRAVVLLLVLKDEGVHVDVLYGRGTPRENMLGLTLALKYMARYMAPFLTFYAATDEVEGIMRRLGAAPEEWYDVFLPVGV